MPPPHTHTLPQQVIYKDNHAILFLTFVLFHFSLWIQSVASRVSTKTNGQLLFKVQTQYGEKVSYLVRLDEL